MIYAHGELCVYLLEKARDFRAAIRLNRYITIPTSTYPRVYMDHHLSIDRIYEISVVQTSILNGQVRPIVRNPDLIHRQASKISLEMEMLFALAL
jgi:hypothetical protein